MTPDDLDRLAQRVLSGLPDLKAPAALEARVQAALAARARLPWWRQGFGAWPAAARIAFVLLCLGLLVLTAQLGAGATLSAAPATGLAHVQTVLNGVGGFLALFTRLLPPGLLTAALIVGAALYAALFGLGAVLYRLLYLTPSPQGDAT